MQVIRGGEEEDRKGLQGERPGGDGGARQAREENT